MPAHPFRVPHGDTALNATHMRHAHVSSRQKAFVDRIYGVIDEFAPGFSSSIIGEDVLSPLDLERVFGLHKGNINHMALGIHQIG